MDTTVVENIPILGDLEISTMSVTKEFSFDAAHQLMDRPQTICGASKHGHRYVLQLEVLSSLNEYQMVVDFLDLKPLVEKELIVPYLDHKDLNNTVHEVHPTAEHISIFSFLKLRPIISSKTGTIIKSIRLYETPTGWCDLKFLEEGFLQYITGFFDADGNISQSGGTELQLRLGNADNQLLNRIRGRIGGSVQGGTLGPLSGAKKKVYSYVAPPGITRALSAALLPYSNHEQHRMCLAVAATFPRLETGRSKATDEQIQKIVNHLNAISLINSPDKEPPHSIETWKEARDKYRPSRREAAARLYESDKTARENLES